MGINNSALATVFIIYEPWGLYLLNLNNLVGNVMTMELDVENLYLANTIDRGGRIIIAIRDALLAKGWTVQGSGSGTVGSAFQNLEQTAGPYDVFTAGTPWRTGMTPGSDTFWYPSGNPNSISHYAAWIRLREPTPSVREFVFQRYTTAGSGTYTTSYATIAFAPGGFTGSGADKDSYPTAPGGQITLLNNGVWFDNNSGNGTYSQYMNMLVSDSARAGNVWPFYCIFRHVEFATFQSGGLVYESLTDTEAGDNQPWVAKAGSLFSVQGLPTTANSLGWGMRRQGDLALDGNSALAGYNFVGGAVPGGAWNDNPLQDGKSRILPIFVGDNVECWKGILEHIRWNPTPRDTPTVLFSTTTNAKLFWGNLLLPWAQNKYPTL